MDKHCVWLHRVAILSCADWEMCSARHWMASVPQSSISSCFCAVMPAFCLYWGCSSAFFFAPVGFLPRMCWKGYNPWPSVQNEPRISYPWAEEKLRIENHEKISKLWRSLSDLRVKCLHFQALAAQTTRESSMWNIHPVSGTWTQVILPVVTVQLGLLYQKAAMLHSRGLLTNTPPTSKLSPANPWN